MANITVTEKTENQSNLYYLQTSLSEIFTQAGCELSSKAQGSRVELNLNVSDGYADIIRSEVIDKLSEVVAINYKYKYFKREICLKGLSSTEYEILLACLISADLDDDKRYVYERLKTFDFLPVDGLYNFRLQPLKKKWADIVSFMPSCFINTQLDDFIFYLLENKKKRVYIDDCRVYDSHYRRLKRASLMGGESAKLVREVILSNCGEVEVSGKISPVDEEYLKRFYKDKIYFSGRYFS
ncbi:MAG: hypothetical protein E7369_05640 [Clostridiales bacterium]|nr:hypothetical protein [Clostridiales bacterium]